jgi:hypothetical protein
LAVLILFVLTGAVMEISTRTTNELIVYNTPGSSTIGIKTGKIINIYSDTSLAGPEIKRDCATLGLRIKINTLKNKFYCIRVGEKNILISNSLDKNILQNFTPDIVVLTGLLPDLKNNMPIKQSTKALIVTSTASMGSYIPTQDIFTSIDTVHFVRKSGAFITRI